MGLFETRRENYVTLRTEYALGQPKHLKNK